LPARLRFEKLMAAIVVLLGALDRGREFEGFGVTDEAAARLEDRCGEVLFRAPI
jgi:hypothetical protein